MVFASHFLVHFRVGIVRHTIISKNVLVIAALFAIDSILVARFILIFCLKNSLLCHDDFLNFFVRVWTTSFALINQFVHFFFPGKKALGYPGLSSIWSYTTIQSSVVYSGFDIIECHLMHCDLYQNQALHNKGRICKSCWLPKS